MHAVIVFVVQVRDLKIRLDGQELFAGEVPQASGQLTRASDCCATVLLTRQQGILDRIMRRDHRRARMTRTARPPTPKESRIYNAAASSSVASARSRRAAGLDQGVELASGSSSAGVDGRLAAAGRGAPSLIHGSSIISSSTAALAVAEECDNEYEVKPGAHRADRAGALSAVEPASASGTSDEESNDATSGKRLPKRSSATAVRSNTPLASGGSAEVGSGINFSADPNDTATVSLVKTIMGRMHRHRPDTASSVATTTTTQNARPRTASDDSFQGRQQSTRHRDRGNASGGAPAQTPSSQGLSPRPASVQATTVVSGGDEAQLAQSEEGNSYNYSDYQSRGTGDSDVSSSLCLSNCALPSVGGCGAPRLPPPECTCSLIPQYVAGSTLVLTFTQNWGDHELIGLTGACLWL